MGYPIKVPKDSEEFIDFASAEIFLKQAKTAHEAGDRNQCLAAIRLVGLALGIIDGPRGPFSTQHLKPDAVDPVG